MNNKTYFDDIQLDQEIQFGSYLVTREEIISFAEKWDPRPFHINEELARDSMFGGVIACAAHLMAIQSILYYEEPNPLAISAGLGSDGFDILLPVFPDDVLSNRCTNVDKRLSKNRPGYGIVTRQGSLINQKGDVIVSQISKVMVSQKPA